MKKGITCIKVHTVDILVSIADFFFKSKKSLAIFSLFVYRKTIRFLFHVDLFQVSNFENYIKDYKNGNSEVLIKGRKGFSSNVVYYKNDEKQHLIPCPLDNIELFNLKGITINENSDLLLDTKNYIAINNICYNKEDRIKYHDGVMLAQHCNTILIKHKAKTRIIESGIILCGQFANNYYHVLYDNYVRLLLLERLTISNNIPLIVDGSTLRIPSLRRAFEVLSQHNNRNVIVLDSEVSYRVNNLYYISHVNHIIPSILSYDLCKTNDIVFDIDFTLKMREKLLSIKSDKSFPKKVFISRARTSRRNYNEDAVFDLLKQEGFERISPETLSFEDQISLFNNASFIIGGGGAAMTNLMFCDSNCRVIIITKTYAQIPCFTTIPYAIGVKVLHYGQQSDKELHSDFVVNPNDVIRCYTFFSNCK